MKREIQLYIGNYSTSNSDTWDEYDVYFNTSEILWDQGTPQGVFKADLFDDESVSMNSSIQNIKDISKVFTDFSQSFNIPASPTNNKIFKHYYNSDIDNGFDARIKVDASIEINNIPFRTGKVQLNEVKMKGNKPYSYDITFFGDTVTLKDLLGEDQLDSLGWLDNFSTNFDYNTLKGALETAIDYTVDSVNYNDAVLVPLISADDRLYYDSSETGVSGNLYPATGNGVEWTNLKYAIRIHIIIRAIEEKYGITFSTDFFNSSQTDYYNLYMWLHREKGKFLAGQELSVYLSRLPSVSNVYLSMLGSIFAIKNTGPLSFLRYYSADLHLVVSSSSVTFNVYLEKDGTTVYTNEGLTGSTTYDLSIGSLDNGSYQIKVVYTTSFTVTSSSYLSLTPTTALGTGTPEIYNFTSDQLLSADLEFPITSNIPKMKVIDFLTALFKMFNLTAYIEDGVVVVKTLDSYYANPKNTDPFNITEYVEMDDSTVKPTVIYKDISFKYSGLNYLFAKNHLEQFNLDWGTEQYRIEDKYIGEKFELIVPFEHMKYERIYDDDTSSATTIQWGWAVSDLGDDYKGDPSVGEPLLFYPYQQTFAAGSTQLRIWETSSSTYDTYQYYIPSNSVSLTSSDNINFKAENNEYTGTAFLDTLFLNYYYSYVSDVYNSKARMTIVSAYLPLKIITSYGLNDKFIISDKEYRINSITTDLSTGKSKIELLNIV